MWIIGRSVAPGVAYGSLSSSFYAVLGAPSFVAVWLACGVLTALLWFDVSWWVARRRRHSAAALRGATVPLLWGA
ncbi:MAG: hypothetical protein PVJ51_05870, partial [Acidobacteriota bacterium]